MTCLTLSNPARRNALSSVTLRLLRDEVQSVRKSDARVLVIRALGPVFCSGHDLKVLTSSGFVLLYVVADVWHRS